VPEALLGIVKNTYNQIIYQEQSMAIAAKAAGFNLVEVDRLRKSAGKKDAAEMAEMEKLFIKKAEELGVITLKEAQDIFRIIKASQRYQFNKSHSVGYGKTTYITAYIKTHFPLAAILGLLKLAKEEQHPLEEIDAIVEESKLFDVNVLPPSLVKGNETFWSDRKHIYFGITDIKGIGQSQFKKLKEMPSTDKWIDFLLSSDSLSCTVVDALIRSGALSHYGFSRKLMLEEYRVYQAATKSIVSKRIIDKIREGSPPENLIQLLEATLTLLPKKKDYNNSELHEKISSDLKLLKYPPAALTDTHSQTVAWELELLGVVLSTSRIKADVESKANTSIKELLTSTVRYPIVAAEILDFKSLITRKGKAPGSRMCNLLLADGSGSMRVVVFPAVFEKIESELVTGATLYFNLDKLKDGYQVKKVWSV